jgi:ABC-type sugar transport system ATPase subunit
MRAIFGADRAASGEVLMRGKTARIRSPRDGLKAGIVLLPEDRKNQGGVLDFSVRKNMTLPSLPKFRVVGPAPFPSERRERKAARELVGRLSIKVADVEYPTRYLSVARQRRRRLHLRRADPGNRRRREGGGVPVDDRSGRPGQRGHLRLL